MKDPLQGILISQDPRDTTLMGWYSGHEYLWLSDSGLKALQTKPTVGCRNRETWGGGKETSEADAASDRVPLQLQRRALQAL